MSYKTQTKNSCGAWCCYYYWWESGKKTYDASTAVSEVEGAFYTGLQFDMIKYEELQKKGFCDPRKIKKALSATVSTCYLCTKTSHLITGSKDDNIEYARKLLGDLKKDVWNSDGMDILKSNLASYAIGIYTQHGASVPKQTIGSFTNQDPLHYALTKHDGGTFHVLDPNIGDWKNTKTKDLLTTNPFEVVSGYKLQYTGLSILINN